MKIKDLHKDHPRIYELAMLRQKEAGNVEDDEMDLIEADSAFMWYDTIEGDEFWAQTNRGNFQPFYDKYPHTNDLPLVNPALFKPMTETEIEQLKDNYREFNEQPIPRIGTEHRTFTTGSIRDNDDDKPLVNHLDPYLRLRFGYLLRAGANKYSKGNWKLGQDTETALESLHRHLAKFELNLNNEVEQDEDHLMAILFNLQLIIKNEEKAGIAVDQYYGTTK